MIEMQGLTKKFDDLTAVNDVTLSVAPGEVLALLGPNGAGKTTTVRMLSAILAPTAGSARIVGHDVVAEGQEVRRQVGVLTEAPGLYTRMTGREYLDFFGEVRGLSARQRRARIDELSAQFRMGFALDRRLGEYSKGMAQKIALMRTLLHNPPVLLLDEPTSAMDPESARLVRDAIMQMRDDDRRAIIVCTHNLPEAEELADRIAIIRKGEIIAEGAVPMLKSQMLGPPLMEVRFAVSSNNGVVPLIGRYAQVQARGERWVRYSTPNPAEINAQLLKALIAEEIPVVTLSEVPQSLEAVYLRVVGEKEGMIR
ncbi:MAG: ABC transporter ATP-binding protein [Anaerolineales bacterium]